MVLCLPHYFLIKFTIRLIWRIINHSGEDVTGEVIEETNQEDSWTPDGQVVDDAGDNGDDDHYDGSDDDDEDNNDDDPDDDDDD